MEMIRNDALKNHRELRLRRSKSDPLMLTAVEKLLTLHNVEHRELGPADSDFDFKVPPTKKQKVVQELDVAKEGQDPSSIGKSNELASGWTVLRMLIPENDDVMNNRYNYDLNKNFGRPEVKIDVYPVAGVGVVMVSAKKNSGRSNCAVEVFNEIHRHFLGTKPRDQQCFTRLLVPAANAKRLIVLHTIRATHEKYPCRLSVYLTDNISVLSGSDVIIEVDDECELLLSAIESIASDMGEFAVDERMMSELKAGNGIRPPKNKIPVLGRAFPRVKAQRRYETSCITMIPLSCLDYIIGKDGANIEAIRKASPATIIIQHSTLEEVSIRIIGDTEAEIGAAEDVMEDLIPKKEGERPVFEGMFAGTCSIGSEDEYDEYELQWYC